VPGLLGSLKVGESSEISVFKERCDGFGWRCGRVDGNGHTLRYSKQESSFAQFLVQVCDGAHSEFVTKKNAGWIGRGGRPLLKCEKWRTPVVSGSDSQPSSNRFFFL
jgi:hypothetical protein